MLNLKVFILKGEGLEYVGIAETRDDFFDAVQTYLDNSCAGEDFTQFISPQGNNRVLIFDKFRNTEKDVVSYRCYLHEFPYSENTVMVVED